MEAMAEVDRRLPARREGPRDPRRRRGVRRAAVGVQRPEARPHPARRGDRDRGARASPSRSSTTIPISPRTRSSARRSRICSATPSSSSSRADEPSRGRTGRLRVIAGAHRGRRLVAPAGRRRPPDEGHRPRGRCSPRSTRAARSSTRPCSTSTRARGALAIEALSRGAARAVLVERDRPRSRRSRRNLDATRLRATGAGVVAADVATLPRRRPPPGRRRSTSCSSIRPTTPPTTRSPTLAAPRWRRPGGSRPDAIVVVERPARRRRSRRPKGSGPAGSGPSAIRS